MQKQERESEVDYIMFILGFLLSFSFQALDWT